MKIYFDSSRFDVSEWTHVFRQYQPNFQFLAQPEDAEHVLVWYPERWDWRAFEHLQSIICLGAGVDGHQPKLKLPTGCALLRLADAGMGAHMADYARYIFNHYQGNFDRYLKQERSSNWQARPIKDASQWHIGVLGAGPLGLAVAKNMATTSASVSLWSRSPKTLPNNIRGFYGQDQLDAFLQQSQLLICLLPLTPDTCGLLNMERLGQLPHGGIVANLSRGGIIDEEALLTLLDSDHLRGAFLDVLTIEPPSAEHPFWQHPDIRITPHISAPTNINAAVKQVIQAVKHFDDHGEYLSSMRV